MTLVLAFAFVAGLLTILAPCTLPAVPLVLGGAAGDGRRRMVGIFAGFGAAFLAATVIVASALAAAGLTTATLRLAAAAFIGLVGLSLAVPSLGQRMAMWMPSRARPLVGVPDPRPGGAVTPAAAGGFWRGAAIGAAIGLIWAPCVGPIMAAVLAAAVVSGPSLAAVAIAAAYVTGAIVPLALIAALGRRAIRSVDARRAGQARRLFGMAMAVAAAVVLAGLDVPIEAGLTQALPADVGAALRSVEDQPAIQEGLDVLRPAATTPGPGGSGATSATGQGPSTASVPLENLGPAPELTGITAWINSEPTTLAALRGKVVLVHFWTFGCINCMHVQPYVKAWYERYAADGFVVIGVHTPELSFERDLGNVKEAVARDGVAFPVAFDPGYATWNAYGNRYWPAFYFIDRSGVIRHEHFGEGDYDGSEAVIRELLAQPG